MVNQVKTGQVGHQQSIQGPSGPTVNQVGSTPEVVLSAVANVAPKAPILSAPPAAVPVLEESALRALGISNPVITYNPDHSPVVGLTGDADPRKTEGGFKIPLLHRSDASGRAVEAGCIRFFDDHRKGLIALYRQKCQQAGNTFETDAAKAVFMARDANGAYKIPEVGQAMEHLAAKYNLDLRSNRALLEDIFKGTYNAEMHQVAHAMAKAAFLDHLDSLPRGTPEHPVYVMVSCGGCASGKSYAIEKGLDSEFTKQFSAIYDAAGEQAGTENKWLKNECERRGISPIYVYVQGDVEMAFQRSVKRAVEKGRMVDVLPFANSYTDGARNFSRFLQENPDVQCILIDNSGSTPREMTRQELKDYGNAAELTTRLRAWLDGFDASHVPPGAVEDFKKRNGDNVGVMIKALKEGAIKMCT